MGESGLISLLLLLPRYPLLNLLVCPSRVDHLITLSRKTGKTYQCLKFNALNTIWKLFVLLTALFFYTTIIILNRTITLLLLAQGIEPNPGPDSAPKSNLSIQTFNCNGLGKTNKLRRLLTKVRKEVSMGGIVLLQETHLKNEETIKYYWKMNYAACGISTQSAGVTLLLIF